MNSKYKLFTVDNSSLHNRVFRNGRHDKETLNPSTDSYLSGAIGTGKNIIWGIGEVGKARVILRKTNTEYESLAGARFNIYKGSGTTPYVIKYDNNTTETLQYLESYENGIFWIGDLSYGVYYLEETAAPAPYSAGKWYYLIVMESGVYISEQYPNRATAESKAAERRASL